MTTSIYNVNPSLVSFGRENIVYGQQGIDTIELMQSYKAVNNPKPVKKERVGMVQMLGLEKVVNFTSTPFSKAIKDIKENSRNEKLKPIVEVFKLTPVGKSLASYMMVIRNTAVTVAYDKVHKKSKGTFCLTIFAGLHQPTKRLHRENMGVIKKFLDRKRAYIYKLDIATDVTDTKPINSKRKESFKKLLAPHAKHGVISTGSSLYVNVVASLGRVSRIIYYDKFLKQTNYLNKQALNKSLKNWKRLEVTVTFDLSKKENRMSFRDFVNSNEFLNELGNVNKVVRRINKKGFDYDYLEYQVSCFLDGRATNNKESKRQFNSLESLERFKRLDYGRLKRQIEPT